MASNMEYKTIRELMWAKIQVQARDLAPSWTTAQGRRWFEGLFNDKLQQCAVYFSSESRNYIEWAADFEVWKTLFGIVLPFPGIEPVNNQARAIARGIIQPRPEVENYASLKDLTWCKLQFQGSRTRAPEDCTLQAFEHQYKVKWDLVKNVFGGRGGAGQAFVTECVIWEYYFTGEIFPGVDPEFRDKNGVTPAPIQQTARELLSKVDPGASNSNGNINGHAGMFTRTF